jgi:hypothetical protein
MRIRSFACLLALATALVGAPVIAAGPTAKKNITAVKPKPVAQVSEATLEARLGKAKSLIDKLTIADQLEEPVRFNARHTYVDAHTLFWVGSADWISPEDKQIGLRSGGVVAMSFRTDAKHSYLVDCAVTGVKTIHAAAQSIDLGADPQTWYEIETQVRNEFEGDLALIDKHITFAISPKESRDISIWLTQPNKLAFTFHHCLVTPVAQ